MVPFPSLPPFGLHPIVVSSAKSEKQRQIFFIDNVRFEMSVFDLLLKIKNIDLRLNAKKFSVGLTHILAKSGITGMLFKI